MNSVHLAARKGERRARNVHWVLAVLFFIHGLITTMTGIPALADGGRRAWADAGLANAPHPPGRFVPIPRSGRCGERGVQPTAGLQVLPRVAADAYTTIGKGYRHQRRAEAAQQQEDDADSGEGRQPGQDQRAPHQPRPGEGEGKEAARRGTGSRRFAPDSLGTGPRCGRWGGLCATEAHASLPSRVTSGRLAATSGGRSLGRSRVSIGEVS
jgi:hypothetical protein